MRRTAISLSALLLATAAFAADPGTLDVTVEGIEKDTSTIPARFALCQPSHDGKSKGGENVRPTISWSGAPAATRSFAVVMKDPDVPAVFDDAGKEGRVVKLDAKRQTFYHWALADIPADTTQIKGGPSHKAPDFGTPAQGSLTKYVDDPTQYGGPCPPWNDERVHHYHYTVYALDVAKLNLPEEATAQDVEAAAGKHTLAQGSVVGTYTLNRALRK